MNLNKFECMAMCRVGRPSKCRKVFKPDAESMARDTEGLQGLQFELGGRSPKAPIRHFTQAVEITETLPMIRVQCCGFWDMQS